MSDTQIPKSAVTNSIANLISYIGDDPKREGLIETPTRVMKSWDELFSGYKYDPSELFKTFIEGACDEMVILKDIDFYSTCEHHLLPFYGTIDIGYLPDGRVIGVSKLARIVEIYSRRLQIQERLVTQIADTINQHLNPKGVMVVCRAKHLCITSRGIKKQNAVMVTSAIRGNFIDAKIRQEFLTLIKE